MNLRLSGDRQSSMGSTSPVCCGFAPRTPPPGLWGSRSWDGSRSGDLEEEHTRRLEDLWESKWTGNGSQNDSGVGPSVKKRAVTKVSYTMESVSSIGSKWGGEKLTVQRSVRSAEKLSMQKSVKSIEKFQLAAGFEEWGIPPYPEDYVDPAEMPSYNEEDWY